MKNLRRLRRSRDLTQVELAGKSGVSRATIQAWERGHPVSVRTARRIAQALGTDWHLFFDDLAYSCTQKDGSDVG